MKKYTIITIIVVGLLLGFITGIVLYKVNNKSNNTKTEIAELIDDDCTSLAEFDEEELLGLVTTNNEEEKTSPNCKIILKIYYEVCNHIIEKTKNIDKYDVNLTEQELKERFPDWEIQKFTPTEIVLYKELDEFCDEHFMLKERDGYIAIYKLNQNETPQFFQTTEISTEYLTKGDLDKIKNGIKVYTEKDLNKTLEDFE